MKGDDDMGMDRDGKVVDIRGKEATGNTPPPLTDIAGQLESMARDIRSGELKPKEAMLILADKDDVLSVYSIGQYRGRPTSLGLLEMAKLAVAGAVPMHHDSTDGG